MLQLLFKKSLETVRSNMRLLSRRSVGFLLKVFSEWCLFRSYTMIKIETISQQRELLMHFAERSNKLSIALVPKPIASLALQFFSIFIPALIPYKPPDLSVANRVSFNDAEDGTVLRRVTPDIN